MSTFTMGSPATYAVTGTGGYSPPTADLRGIGILDLVVPSGTGFVSVLLGYGDGTFATKVDYTVGAGASTACVGSLRGNGILDIVTANVSTNTVSVLLGIGDGTFAAKVDYTVGANPYGIALGDLRNIGKLDIVVTSTGVNGISVILGNGDGTFGAHTNYTGPFTPYCLMLGSLRGNGVLDVITEDYGNVNSTISVLLGDGLGGFGSRVGYTYHPSGPFEIALGDLNLDGKLDVIGIGVGTLFGSFLGNGAGAIGAAWSLYVPASQTGSSLYGGALADMDGHGIVNLVMSSVTTAGSVGIIFPTNNLPSQPDYATILAGANSQGITIGDFNGDGKLDIMSQDGVGNLARVWLQTTADYRAETPSGTSPTRCYKHTVSGERRSGAQVIGH